MLTIFLKESLTYDGTQLGSAFFDAYGNRQDDMAIAFIGPADVPTENLVDEDDRRAGRVIKSDRMLHFLIWLPGRSLETGVAIQRLFIATILEVLRFFGVNLDGTPMLGGSGSLIREGDDIFRVDKAGRRKLSVSIATTNGDASLIHIGLNVVTTGAPLPVAGLADLVINEREFAAEALRRFADETSEIIRAKNKVRMVG